jgi:endoglucanase
MVFGLAPLWAIIVGILLSAAPAAYPEGSVVAQHGKLRVEGTRLLDSAGKPVRLRGLSTHGLQWFGWGEFLNDERLDWVVRDWKIDLLRISMYPDEDGYLTDKPRFAAMVDRVVDEAGERGIYCIIDWHMLDPGDPHARLAEAREFFDRMARLHGSKPHVMFEICNEPNGDGVTWDRIKAYAAEVIPVIRKWAPDSIILVGTEDWSSFGASGQSQGRTLLDSPLQGPLAHNVMYTFHFYAASHLGTHREVFDRVASKLPVFVTEWGMQEYTGDGPNDQVSTAEWMKLLDKHNVSWAYWNYSNEQRSGAVFKQELPAKGPYSREHLKESGVLVWDLLLQGK